MFIKTTITIINILIIMVIRVFLILDKTARMYRMRNIP